MLSILRAHRALALVLITSVLAVACGGDTPGSPSNSAQGVVLRGAVSGMDALSRSGGASSLSATAAVVTVSVLENPAITTTVGADGSFTLRGLPEGGFTLVFTSSGSEIGRLTFTEVRPNQEITITVRVASTGVALVDQSRNGIGHGDLEIEGLVTSVLALNPAGESRFLINGKTVVARPGDTAIREGNRGRSVNDVTVGRQVHVKGVWLTPEGTTQPVLAHEIKLQGDATTPTPETPNNNLKCAAGGKAEVEGLITAKGGASITVTQQGKGDYLCDVAAGTPIRKGNTSYTFAQLQTGWRVHVKGTNVGLSGAACQVQASEVKVQGN
jgi:hypothetical protein